MPPLPTSISAAASPSTSPAHQLGQLWVDDLLGLCEHGHQVTGLGRVTGGEQGVGGARVALATGST